jgi:hypothetical protein
MTHGYSARWHDDEWTVEEGTSDVAYLVYANDAPMGGYANLDCLARCGYGGSGTRAPVLIGR